MKNNEENPKKQKLTEKQAKYLLDHLGLPPDTEIHEVFMSDEMKEFIDGMTGKKGQQYGPVVEGIMNTKCSTWKEDGSHLSPLQKEIFREKLTDRCTTIWNMMVHAKQEELKVPDHPLLKQMMTHKTDLCMFTAVHRLAEIMRGQLPDKALGLGAASILYRGEILFTQTRPTTDGGKELVVVEVPKQGTKF